MIYKLDDVINIAKAAVKERVGFGDRELVQNSESWAPYLRFLGKVVGIYRPHACLECGVYMGTATAHMAIANPRTLVIGVDKEYHPAFPKVTGRFENIVQVVGDTTDPETVGKVLQALQLIDPVNTRRIGLFFIDSTHDGDTPKREYQLYEPYFDEECLIVCDDLIGPAHLEVKMARFWEWLPGEKAEVHFLHPPLNAMYDNPGFGVSIVRRGVDYA
jgi:predicted O-methyltransferase YrrM